MPPMSAPFIAIKVKEVKSTEVSPKQLPWAPINMTISIPEPPVLSEEELDERKQRRDHLASIAQNRYARCDTHLVHELEYDLHRHSFRDRQKAKELAGDWAGADQVLHERERVRRQVAIAEATYLRHPPYPKQGGGVKNVEFSYMKSGYDYRTRQPSKEVAGTWPIMRVRPLTESARINEAAAQHRPRDTLGGGRWTVDPRYGNPPVFTPTTTGSNFRQAAPNKWSTHGRSPPPTAPGALKWRGGFATDFPPRTAAETRTLNGRMSWLHHTEAYADHLHDSVALHMGGFRPPREKNKELTGGDGAGQFWPQTPVDVYIPNPALTCTWNQVAPPSPLPPRAYPKSKRTDGLSGTMSIGMLHAHGDSGVAGELAEQPSAVGTSASGA